MNRPSPRRVFFSLLFLISAFHQPAVAQDSAAADQIAQNYLGRLRHGEDLSHNVSVADLAASIRSSPIALTALSNELAEGTPALRLRLVELLEKVGLELDPPAANKFQIIRDHRVIRALVIQGFAKSDAASEAAAGILLKSCRPADLAAFADLYTDSLRQLNGRYLHLATKAKTLQARPYVERMASSPTWKDQAERYFAMRIAQAALGNRQVEDEFIDAVRDAEKNTPPAPKNRFYNVGMARDGTELARRLDTLGAIGTPRSLLVVCGYLRSPLKSYVPGVSERSVRYAALDALRHNFPDERILHSPTDLAGWRAAEAFCTIHLGAVFDGPTPDIPPHLAYPHM